MTASTPRCAAVHRREFTDFHGLWQALSHAGVLSESQFAAFTFKAGPVWLRFNQLTKGGASVRIVALFSSTLLQQFGSLLLVACTSSACPPRVLWRSNDEVPFEPTHDQLDELFSRYRDRSMVVLPWAAPVAFAAAA